MEDELVITPAATGGMFDLYHNLQSRLNNALSGSHFGISSTLGGQFPKTAGYFAPLHLASNCRSSTGFAASQRGLHDLLRARCQA